MPVDDCLECQRLWKVYTDASFTFVRINREMKMATLRSESPEVMALLREGVEAAAQRRHAALEHLKQHEDTHGTCPEG
jgi:hypothetical protein